MSVRKMSGFRWTAKSEAAALALADGQTQVEAAQQAGVDDRTIRRWLTNPEFAEEVDRLTLMTGIASKAERLRVAKRMIRQLRFWTQKDLLDWLKYAQGETDGIKLDLTNLLSAVAAHGAPLAPGGPTGASDAADQADDANDD